MVHHGTDLEPPLPTDPVSLNPKESLQTDSTIMDGDQHTALVTDIVEPVTYGYDVTEKCLNWQNNCANSENAQSNISEHLDNVHVFRAEESVDNIHCLPGYQHSLSKHFFIEENKALPNTVYENEYASDYCSQEKLEGDSDCCSNDALSHCGGHQPHHSILSADISHRTRRDSEESEESMDTSSTSSPYACPLGESYACTENGSSINSADNLTHDSLSDDENGQSQTEMEPACNESACANSFDSVPQIVIPMPTTEYEPIKVSSLGSEPFSSHVEEADPEYAKHPPIVTDNLIVVEDESFLYQSQQSLDQPLSDDILPTGFLFRASTLPDLQAYQRHHEEYGMCWAYQDARIFLSEDTLHRSMCSLINIDNDSLSMNVECHLEGKTRQQKPPTRQLVDADGNPIKIVPSSEHTTVMILLSLCVSILFAAADAVRNLQTSLYAKDELGLTSLALIFAGYTLGSLVSSPLMLHVQPRACLVISIIPNILFLLANLSSSLWLLAPISFLLGISMAITWSVLSTYITYLASGHAISKGENIKVVCSRFFNYFSLVYQSFLILGNLASSILLKYGNSMHNMNSSFFSSSPSSEVSATEASRSSSPILNKFSSSDNSSLIKSISTPATGSTKDILFNVCGPNYYSQGHVIDGGDPWLHPNDGTIYMLHGAFMGCILVSLGIAVFGIEPLNMSLHTSFRHRNPQVKSLCASITRSFKATMYGCMAVKFVLLLPLFVYSVMQFGFVSAEVTVAFITCPVGIAQIGFSMVFFTLGRFPTSFFCGFLTKKCGRLPLITLAATINLISLIVLAQWHPGANDVYLIYTLMFCWGLSDGIWISQVNGLISSVFKLQQEATLGGMHVAQGLGLTIFLSSSKFFDMRTKVLFMMAACFFALLGYLVMRICLYCENLQSQRQEKKSYLIYTGPRKEDV